MAEMGALMSATVTLQPLHGTHLLWHMGLGATGAPGEAERCQHGGDLPRDPWKQQLSRSPRPPWGMEGLAATLIPHCCGFSSGHLAHAW